MHESTFGRVLRELREANQISQKDLGRRCGRYHSYISRLESGNRDPSREVVVEIANSLDLTSTQRRMLFASAGFIERIPTYDELINNEPYIVLTPKHARAISEFADALRMFTEPLITTERVAD